jgi:cytochrome c553
MAGSATAGNPGTDKAILTVGINKMRRTLPSLFLAVLAAVILPAMAENTFEEDLAQVDYALKNNPTQAIRLTLESCLKQRNSAAKLHSMGYEERARRALQYCFDSLQLSRDYAPKVTAPSQRELADKAMKEFDKALTLKPDVANGLAIYRECAACHEPEGWGRTTGSVPQIAGQHRTVLIKQLADFRAGNREAVLMVPYATVEAIGGTQAVADVTEYISTLEMSVDNGKGPGDNLAVGERLFQEKCAECHGANGEGSNEEMVPRIQAQHYKYMLRQFKWIRSGTRQNASDEMTAHALALEQDEINAVLDYTSRLQPPEEFQAPEGWKNPDFVQ